MEIGKVYTRVAGVGVGDESSERVEASVGGDPTKLLDFQYLLPSLVQLHCKFVTN